MRPIHAADWASLDDLRKLHADNTRYREIIGNVVRWICKYWSPELTRMRTLREATGLDEQAARDLCREFGVDENSGEPLKEQP
jgi:hypothetical protein